MSTGDVTQTEPFQLASMSVSQLATRLEVRGAAAICISTALSFLVAGMWREVFEDLADICVPHKNPKDPPVKQLAFNAGVAIGVTVISVYAIFFLFKAAAAKPRIPQLIPGLLGGSGGGG